MQNLESRFNHKYLYPWVFLNDEEFTNEFKGRVMLETNAKVYFGLIPKENWAEESRKRLTEQKVIYGGSSSYRNMCRFNSGYFFQHPLLQQFKYYWRVEPNVQYFCDMNYDPFRYMIDNNHTYGFTIALYEVPETVTTLWESVNVWSNFEIADMDFWRSDAYQAFFLDAEGGFYYERWGDAPVHSIAAALLLPKNRLHFFQDIGYQHATYQHCPSSDESMGNTCSCHRWNTIALEYEGQCYKAVSVNTTHTWNTKVNAEER
ncbi:glycosyltransferase family 15 protein [Lentinula novae-zelandiae]|nr:glycosyltransferase family 15 protein [Lentinula novae-zelandiae]